MTRPMKARLTLFTTLVGAMLLGACGDVTTAPQANSAAVNPLTITLGRENTGSGTFSILPNERITVIMGDHRLTIPMGAVCDVATSGYGENLWDTSCTPSAVPVSVTATWTVENGNAKLTFSPDLRFVPTTSTNVNDWVVLQLKNANALLSGSKYQIYWRNAAGAWVDEATTDSTLRAWTNRPENRVSRRLKHFSGYVVGTSFSDEQQSMEDPNAGTEVIAY